VDREHGLESGELSFRDRAALRVDPNRTARALQSAIDATAWELAKQFM
jgi:hypothetical protein